MLAGAVLSNRAAQCARFSCALLHQLRCALSLRKHCTRTDIDVSTIYTILQPYVGCALLRRPAQLHCF